MQIRLERVDHLGASNPGAYKVGGSTRLSPGNWGEPIPRFNPMTLKGAEEREQGNKDAHRETEPFVQPAVNSSHRPIVALEPVPHDVSRFQKLAGTSSLYQVSRAGWPTRFQSLKQIS